jgi:outer membrane protein assembly factor BamD (BamD/ComL family)
MYAIAGVERRIRHQRIRRRASYAVATACAVAVLVLTLWPASPSAPVADPAQPNEAAARLAALNDRIASLERQVAELETALERREPFEIELSLGNLAQEESAAIVYEAGRFYERDNRNVALALSRYRDVVARFPNTRSAAFAAERIHALTQAQEEEGLTS